MTNTSTLSGEERGALIEKEKARISIERYKMKIISDSWLTIPAFSSFYLLYACYEYWRYKTYDPLLIISSGILFAAFAIANSLKEGWEKGLWIKYEAHGYPEDGDYLPFTPKSTRKLIYKEGYLYDDSETFFIFYQILKGICYLASIIGVGVIGLFAFSGIEKAVNDASLKDIGILIIILLVMVIFNQRR